MNGELRRELRETLAEIGRGELLHLQNEAALLGVRETLREVLFLIDEHEGDFLNRLSREQIDAVALAVVFSSSYASLKAAGLTVEEVLQTEGVESHG